MAADLTAAVNQPETFPRDASSGRGAGEWRLSQFRELEDQPEVPESVADGTIKPDAAPPAAERSPGRDRERWSGRKTLLFILASCTAFWAVVALLAWWLFA